MVLLQTLIPAILLQSGVHAGHKNYGGPLLNPIASTPPLVECPPGYEIEGDKCVRAIVEPLVPVCPEGIMQPDQTCLVVLPPVRMCPPEFLLNGPVCSRSSTAPASLSCPPDYIFEAGYKKSASVCSRVIEGPPGYICPPMSVQAGTECIMESILPPAITCPDGAILQGSVCAIAEIFECAPAFGAKHAKKAKRLLGAVEPQEQISQDFLDGADTRHLGIKVAKKVNFVPDTHSEINVISQQCQRRTLAPPLLTCPNGGVLVGRECIISQAVGPIQGPPSVSVETAPPTATCPPGFAPCGGYKHSSKKKAHECCSVEEAPFTFGCPEGFGLIGDACQAVRPAEFICSAPNFKKHKHRDECMRFEYAEPIITFSTQVVCVGGDCIDKKHGSKKLK